MPLLLIVAIIAYPFDRERKFMFILVRMWTKLLLTAAGAKVELSGADKLPDPPAVVVSNHISHMDVPAIVSKIKSPFTFLTKQSLYRIPVFGLALRVLGMVPVDRDDPNKRRLALSDAQNLIKKGCKSYIFFFPEGARSLDGNLLPFKNGAFVMAKRTKLPLVVIKVSGSDKVLPPRTLDLKKGDIKVEVVETLYSDVFFHLSVEELSAKVKSLLETESGEQISGCTGA